MREKVGTLARVLEKIIEVKGTQQDGWLAITTAFDRREAVRPVTFSFEIQFDGSGYLLCCKSQDESLFTDTWHESLEDAQRSALRTYGIQRQEWMLEAESKGSGGIKGVRHD